MDTIEECENAALKNLDESTAVYKSWPDQPLVAHTTGPRTTPARPDAR